MKQSLQKEGYAAPHGISPLYQLNLRIWMEHCHTCKTTDPLHPMHQQAIQPSVIGGSSGEDNSSTTFDEEGTEEEEELESKSELS